MGELPPPQHHAGGEWSTPVSFSNRSHGQCSFSGHDALWAYKLLESLDRPSLVKHTSRRPDPLPDQAGPENGSEGA